jgi:hypothetical protein
MNLRPTCAEYVQPIPTRVCHTHAHTHARTHQQPTHARTHTHTHTHTHTRTHTHNNTPNYLGDTGISKIWYPPSSTHELRAMLPPNSSAGGSVQHPHEFVQEFVGDPLLRARVRVLGGGGGGGGVREEDVEEEVVYAARGFTGGGPSRVDFNFLQSLPHASSCRCSRCRATSAQAPQGLQGLQGLQTPVHPLMAACASENRGIAAAAQNCGVGAASQFVTEFASLREAVPHHAHLPNSQTGTAKNGSASQNSSMVPHMPGVHNAVNNTQNLQPGLLTHEPTRELRPKMGAYLLSPSVTEGQSVLGRGGGWGGGSLYLPPSPASSLHAKILKSPLFS